MTPLPALPSPDLSTPQSRLQHLADKVALIVWMTDASGTCIFLNKSCLFAPHQWSELNRVSWAAFMHPDDQARVLPILEHASTRWLEYQVEYRLLTSDGTGRWIMSCGAPRMTPDGALAGFSGTMVDVSERYLARAQLLKSEAEFRLLTEYSSDLISHCNAQGQFLYTSPSYLPVLGYEAADLLGTLAFDFIHPDDVARMYQEVSQQRHQFSPSSIIEIRHRHRQGHYLWVGVKAQLLLDATSRSVTSVVAIARDITPQKQAQEALTKREEQFRSLTQLSSDWYWETDVDDRFTFMSEGLGRLFGTPPEEVLGKTRSERAADLTQPGVQAYIDKVGRREPFKDLPYSAFVASKDCVQHAVVSGEPVFDDGEFKGYRGTGRDVTKDIAIASRIAQLGDENRAIVENSLDIMATLDHKGRYLRVNRTVRFVLGYEPQELLGHHYSELMLPQDRTQRRSIESALRVGHTTVADFDCRWVKKDGQVVHLSSSLRWSASRQLIYASGRDVTDRHHARTALEHSRQNLVRVLESIGDGFFALDRAWRTTYLNQKTADLFGRDPPDLLGKTLWEFAPDSLRPDTQAHFIKAMETGNNHFFTEYSAARDTWTEVRLYPHAEGLSVFFHDITQRRKADEAIHVGERRLRNVINLTPSGYLIADPLGTIIEVNPAFCSMAGYPSADLVGCNMTTLLSNCVLDGTLFRQGGVCAAHGQEWTLTRQDGVLIYVLVNLSIERDSQGHALRLTAFLTDITQRKYSEAQLEQLATHDALTGLPNRTLINTRLQHRLDTLALGTTVALMFIDLDLFKKVNDSYGHASGDALLQEVARRLREVMRPDDLIARLGGDEFIMAASCSAGTDEAARIAERLLGVLATPFFLAQQEVRISASIGISMYPDDASTGSTLYQNADMAMYRAKTAGRNDYCFFEARMSTEARLRMTLEHDLPRALERQEFELHYQPRINLRTMHITGMEALIRWHHPRLGLVSPLDFIPIAEEQGTIDAIGQWVLEEGCRQCLRLNRRFGLHLHVSINVAARQLKGADYIGQVVHALRDTGLAPGFLELELTESALIDDVELSASLLTTLRAMGIRISVDDFGTGYSGLSYLRRFPLDILKLDRSFLSHETAGVRSDAFIKAFVDMAHTLNLSVVAEGVEDAETCRFLRDCACDEAQGYLFAKPLTLTDFTAYLATYQAGVPGVASPDQTSP